MANCVDINHPSVNKLANSSGLSLEDTGAVIAVWQDENNNIGKFPTEEQFTSELQTKNSDFNYPSLSDAQLENLIMDTTFSVFNNPTIAAKQMTPIGHDILVDRKNEINAWEESIQGSIEGVDSKKSATSSIAYNEFHKLLTKINADGKIGIGALSLASTFHSLFQYGNVYIKPITDKNGKIVDDTTIKFLDKDGKLYQDSEEQGDNAVKESSYSRPVNENTGAWRLDKINTFDGKSILDVISYMQSASVDNAKDQVLYALNLNGLTFDVAALIARAGFNEQFVTAFTSQPTLKKYVERMLNYDNFTNNEFNPNKEDDILTELYKELGFNYADVSKWSISPVSLSDMEEAIKNGGEDLHLQAKLLHNFTKYKTLAKQVSKVQKYYNVDTKMLGKNMYSNIQAMKLDGITMVANVENLGDGTTQGAALEYGVNKAVEIFNNKQLLIHDTPVVKELLELVSLNSTASGDTINDKFATEFFNNIRAGLFTEIGRQLLVKNEVDSNVKKYKDGLIYGINSLAKRVVEYKSDNSNFFINTLVPKVNYDTTLPDTVEGVSSGDISANFSLNMSIGWLKLLSADKSSEEYKLGFDLVMYSLLNGNERTARDFGRYLPYDYLVNSGFGEIANSINWTSDEVSNLMKSNFVRQYFQHNPFRAKEVDSSDMSGSKLELPSSFKLKDVDKGSKYFNVLNGSVIPVRFLRYKSKTDTALYEYDGEQYIRIPVLGDRANLLKEYDIATNYVESSFNDNPKVTSNPGLMITENSVTEVNEGGENSVKKYQYDKGINELLHTIEHRGTAENAEVAKFFRERFDSYDKPTLQVFNASNPTHIRDGGDYRGRYINGSNSIVIKPSELRSDVEFQETVLHEITHSLLDNTIILYDKNYSGLTSNQNTGVKNLYSIYNTLNSDKNFISLLENANIVSSQPLYPMSNLREFVAFTMSNSKFQDILKGYDGKGKIRMWDKLMNAFKKMLGVNSTTSLLADALDSVITATVEPLKLNDQAERLLGRFSTGANLPGVNNMSEYIKQLPLDVRKEFARQRKEGLIQTKCE